MSQILDEYTKQVPRVQNAQHYASGNQGFPRACSRITTYDPELHETLGLPLSPRLSIPPFFKPFRDLLEARAKNRKTSRSNYNSESGTSTLNLTLAHAYNNNCIQTPLKNQVLAFVHPFYAQICHYRTGSGRYREEVRDIGKKSIETLKQAKTLGLSRVVFETADHYPFGTAHLVEQGLVDRVIVTKADKGDLQFPNEAFAFANRQLLIGGGFINKCLYQTVSELDLHTRDITLLEDLIFYSPEAEEHARYNGPDNWQGVPITPLKEAIEKIQQEAQAAK